METLIIVAALLVIGLFVGRLNELFEGRPSWERLKLAVLFLLMLPFAGFAIGGWCLSRLGVKPDSFATHLLYGVVVFSFQFFYLAACIQLLRSLLAA